MFQSNPKDIISLTQTSSIFNCTWIVNSHAVIGNMISQSINRPQLSLAVFQLHVEEIRRFKTTRWNQKDLTKRMKENESTMQKAREYFIDDMTSMLETISMTFWADLLFPRAYYLVWHLCFMTTAEVLGSTLPKGLPSFAVHATKLIDSLPYDDLLAIYVWTKLLQPEGNFGYLIPDNGSLTPRSFQSTVWESKLHSALEKFSPYLERAMAMALSDHKSPLSNFPGIPTFNYLHPRPKTLHTVFVEEFSRVFMHSQLADFRRERGAAERPGYLLDQRRYIRRGGEYIGYDLVVTSKASNSRARDPGTLEDDETPLRVLPQGFGEMLLRRLEGTGPVNLHMVREFL